MSTVVLGDLMVDDYRVVSVDRVSPEAPCLVGLHRDSSIALGGAGNVAANYRQLTDDFKLIGICDIPVYLPLLERYGIKNHFLIQGSHAVKTRFVDFRSRTQLFRYDIESSVPIPDDIMDLSPFSVLLIVDYKKGMINSTLMRQIKGCAVNVVSTKSKIPHKILPEDQDDAVNILVVNDFEFRSLEMVWHYHYIVRTEGDRGVSIFKIREIPYEQHVEDLLCHIDAHRVDVFDVTGAGDTFVSVVAYCLDRFGFSEDNLISSCHCANYESSLVVSKPGTTVVCSEAAERINSKFTDRYQ